MHDFGMLRVAWVCRLELAYVPTCLAHDQGKKQGGNGSRKVLGPLTPSAAQMFKENKRCVRKAFEGWQQDRDGLQARSKGEAGGICGVGLRKPAKRFLDDRLPRLFITIPALPHAPTLHPYPQHQHHQYHTHSSMADVDDHHDEQEAEEEEEEESGGFNFAPGVWNELIGEDIQYKVRGGRV